MFSFKVFLQYSWIFMLIKDASSAKSFELHAIIGEPLQLSCSRHRPNDTIQWSHDGQPVRLTHRVTVSEELLQISRVRNRDSGEYICSTGGEEKTPVTVIVQDLERPRIVVEHPRVSPDIAEGAHLHLNCDTRSRSDDIAFHWYRNGVKLVKNNRTELKRGHLVLTKTSVSDNGVYSCTVHVRGRTEDSVDSFVLSIPGTNTPILKVAPKHETVAVGSTARFECVFGGNNVTWYRLDETHPLEKDDRIYSKDSVLTIEKVTYADEGFYSCEPEVKQGGGRTKYAAKLTVARLHQMSETSFDPLLSNSHTIYIDQSNYMEISCLRNRHDKPRPDIVWSFEGKKIVNQSSILIEDDTLIVKSVDFQNGGEYTCQLENMAAQHTMSFFVFVIPRPKFLNPPKIIESADHVPHTCQFHSKNIWPINENLLKFWNTTLQIQTSKTKKHRHHVTAHHKMAARQNDLEGNFHKHDRRQFHEDLYLEFKTKGVGLWDNRSDEFVAATLKRIDSSLTIKDYKKIELDSDVFWCRNMWDVKPSSRTMRAATPDQLKFTPVPFNKRLVYNTTGKIICKASGNPQPNITWYRNDKDPLPQEASHLNGTLIFNPSLREHKGNYSCVAANINEEINTTIFIDVVVPPRVIWPEQDSQLRVKIGQDVWLNCRAEGDPLPTIHWDKNLQMLVNNISTNGSERLQIFQNGSLHISNIQLEDSDRYSCTAGSSAGLSRHDLQLIVGTDDGSKEDSGVANTAVLVSVCVAAAYMILALALMYYCRRKRSGNDKIETNELETKAEDRDKLMETPEEANGEQNGGVSGRKNKSNGRLKAKNGHLKKSDGENTTTGGESATAKSDNSSISKKQIHTPNQYEKLSLARSLLTDCVTLGRGEFGEIILAKLDYRKLKNPITNCENPIKAVMAKSLCSKEPTECMEFKRQLDIFSKIKHENVARIIGLCNDSDPHYLVFEYTDWGDFKQYLQSTQTDEELEIYKQKLGSKLSGEILPKVRRQPAKPLNDEECLSLVTQLANGAACLAVSRLVHKDISARNCIISSNMQLKLSIPALSKTAYVHEYYKHNNRVIPLRWSPQEIVIDEDYSSKSDVYMFAVTVWEIYNKGELPFARSNDNTVLNHIKSDTLKWQHSEKTPIPIRHILDKCLSQSPRERSNFEDIVEEIARIPDDLKRYSGSEATSF